MLSTLLFLKTFLTLEPLARMVLPVFFLDHRLYTNRIKAIHLHSLIRSIHWEDIRHIYVLLLIRLFKYQGKFHAT
jgi:hypothetical protein